MLQFTQKSAMATAEARRCIVTPALACASVASAVVDLPVFHQGEIAYVLDGNIWLLDLVTGASEQLTADGENRWPSWGVR